MVSYDFLDFSVISPLGEGKSSHTEALISARIATDYAIGRDEETLLRDLWAPLKHHVEGIPSHRVGVIVSNSKYQFRNQTYSHVSSQKLASWIGPNAIPYNITAACATGLVSVMTGVEWLRRGWVDVIIAGSLETSKVPLVEAGFSQMGVLSKSGTCRPFTESRDGFVIGEGGALFVLTRSKGGTSPLAIIENSSLMCDSTDLLAVDPTGASIARLIRQTIGAARIDYVNAHGTGTRRNDAAECLAFETVFVDYQPLISSTKAQTGHLLGATGSVELALCLLMLSQQIALPAIVTRDSPSNLMQGMLPFQQPPPHINRILTLNYGFGGHLAALMIATP